MVTLVERDMAPAELELMNRGFAQHSLEHGNPIETSVRFGFVAMEGDAFVGCSSGLATKGGGQYSAWFYLSDLFVEKSFRRKGVGSLLLRSLEDRVRGLGVRNIWTWTAGYEAPGFYQKEGYSVFAEFKEWYTSGHSRVGMWKLA